MQEPLVTICCITYNHETYIHETIEGFLSQKTNFPIQIIIHDDASTDNTAKVIKKYAEKHPEIIVPILQKENQWSKGISPSQKYVWPRVKSKFMALCEGDDFWIDPLKLQKQVDFLENNLDYGLVYTQTKIFNQQKNKLGDRKSPTEMHPKGMLYYNPIPTVTTVFKTELMRSFLQEEMERINSWPMKDYPMWIWMYYNSKIHYLKEVTAVYRILESSVSHFINGNKRMDFMESSFEMTKHFANKYLSKTEFENFLEFKHLSLYKASLLYKTNRHKKYYDLLKKSKNKNLKTVLFIFAFEKLFFRKLYGFYKKLKK